MQLYLALFWDRLMTLPISAHDAVRVPTATCFRFLSTHLSYNQPLMPHDTYNRLAYPKMTARIDSYVLAFRQNSTMTFSAMNFMPIQALNTFLASNPHPIPSLPAQTTEKHTFDHAFVDLDDMDSFFDKY